MPGADLRRLYPGQPIPASLDRSPSELVRGPGRRARSAQRHINIAQQVRAVPARNHRVEHLADAAVSRMRPRAEAKTGPAPHGLLSALDHRPHLRTVRYLLQPIDASPTALQPI